MAPNLAAALCLAAAVVPGQVLAETADVPAVDGGQHAVVDEGASFELYQPQDKDERGLWMEMAEAERSLKSSPAVIDDPELNAYVRDVLCRTVGANECRNIRLYLVRTPYFNASIAPNGVMQVWSGLLLRLENEAQLAAILGHEYTHFRNRHSLQLFRDAKAKSNAAILLSFTGIGLIASIALVSDFFEFSREMENEADAGGLDYMAAAGYDSREAAVIWERLRAEMDATAQARNTKSRKDKNGGLFGTHPPSGERVERLTQAAGEKPGVPGATGEARFRAAMKRFWPLFIDDQLKMNDFGASDFLLTSLGERGWTPELLYARAELYRRKGTQESADESIGFYSRAIDAGSQIAELWRGRGLALLKSGRKSEGQADLKEYITRAPDAGDKAMMAMLSGGQ